MAHKIEDKPHNRSLVLGTAGHIDHGKTLLVKALTGTDTDRLPEEKKRGITIVLGFAQLELGDLNLSIVDVPGHEKFVRTMVAGAGGIDMAMLVVAASESVMPQTREHLDIIDLLGIDRLVVALNKIDLADEEMRLIAEEEVRDMLKPYPNFRDAPIVPCSAIKYEGLDELKAALTSAAEGLEPGGLDELFRMPVDRSFTIHGHGTIVTGTVVGGRIEKGEEVELVGAGIKAQAREITTHNETVREAHAGMRAGINLAGVDKRKARTGYTLAKPGRIWPASHFAVELKLLEGTPAPVKDRGMLTFHTGTMRSIAQIRIPKPGRIEPGESALAFLTLADSSAALAGDRFILRSFARGRTIGGGLIVDKLRRMPVAKLRVKSSELRVNKAVSDIDKVGVLAEIVGSEGISRLDMLNRAIPNEAKLDSALKELKGKDVIREVADSFYVSTQTILSLAEAARKFLEEYHRKNPLEQGAATGEIRTSHAFKRLKDPVVNAAIEEGLTSGELVKEGAILRLKSHKIKTAPDTDRILAEILGILKKDGLKAPNSKELSKKLDIHTKELAKLLGLLANRKKVLRIAEGYYIDAHVADDLINKVKQYLATNNGMTPVDFKELTGLTRKHAIPLLEYLDSSKITLRVGDKRVLFGKK